MQKYVIGMTGFCTAMLLSAVWSFMPSPVTTLDSLIQMARIFDKHVKYDGRREQRQVLLKFFLLGALIAHAYISIHAEKVTVTERIAPFMSGTVFVKAEILTSAHKQQFNRYLVEVDQIDGKPLTLSLKVMLQDQDTSVRFWPGQVIETKVKLSFIKGHANPGQWDIQRWAMSHETVIRGEIVASPSNKLVAHSSSLHTRINLIIKQSGVTHHRWIRALITGDRSDLTASDWQLLKETGTAHLFTVSGMHLGIMVASVFLILRTLITFMVFCAPRLHSQSWRFMMLGVSLLVTWFYVEVVNYQIPVFRAAIMVSLAICCSLLPLHWSLRDKFIVMTTACLLFFPFSMLAASFYLSVGAVALILLLLNKWQSPLVSFIARVKYYICFQVILSLSMSPLLLWWFDALSVYGVLVNILLLPAIPIFMPILLLAMLAYINWAQDLHVVISLCNDVIEILINFLLWAQYYGSDFFVETKSNSFVIVMICFLVAVVMPWFKQKIIILSTLSALIFHQIVVPTPASRWSLHVFDVGHGTATMVTQQERAIIIDTGPRNQGSSMMQTVIIPAFKQLGIKSVDAIFISHGDSDHSGGLQDLLNYLKENQPRLPALYTNLSGCRSGTRQQWLELTIEMLWPIASMNDENNSSCVIRISDDNHSVLVPGDVSRSVEYELLRRKLIVSSDILIAPHHGSDTSSSPAFVDKVAPRFVVFTHGHSTKWKIPSIEVIEKYFKRGSEMLSTAKNGYLRFDFLINNDIVVNTHRNTIKERWYRRLP